MNTEFGNIKDQSKSVGLPVVSLASIVEDGPPADASQLECEPAMFKENGSTEHHECKSRLNPSPENQESKEDIAVRKESWADWGVVACVFLSNLIAAIDITGFGVFYPYLMEHFHATTAAVGWCSSISGFFQAIVGKMTHFHRRTTTRSHEMT